MLLSKGLHLEADGLPATTGTLELAALGDGARLDTIVGVWVVDRGAVTEVLLGLTNVLATTQQNGVGTLGGTQGKLIEGQALSASLDDARTSGLSETQGGNLQARDLQQARIVSDSADDNCSLVLLSLHVSLDARDRDRKVVDSGLAQSLGNHLGELGVTSAADEAV